MSLDQSQIFLIFILDGIIIGLLFDTFRSLRKAFKTNDIFTYIEDIIFWLMTACLLLFTIFKFGNR